MVDRIKIEALIALLAEAEGIDPELVIRQCQQESQFKVDAQNKRSGAYGLMQLMSATAIDLGVNRKKWHENVFGGVKYDGQMFRMFGGDSAKMLAAYNWGPGNLRKCIAKYGDNWRSHLPEETSNYLRIILKTPETTNL